MGKKRGGVKFIFLGCLVLYFLLQPTVVKAESLFSSELEMIYNDLSGPGSANAIYEEGAQYNGNFTLTDRQEMDEYDFSFNLKMRTEEDMYSQDQALFLSRLKASFRNRESGSQFNIGDTFEFFDQYVLNSSLKGLSYRHKNSNDQTTTFVYGYDYPRWNNIYDGDYPAVTRRSLGINYENNVNDLNWGVSLLNVDDEEKVDSADILYTSNVIGVNWEHMPLAGLTIKGNSAYSDTDDTQDINYSGTAHQINIFSNAKEGRAEINYERVSPDFKTLLGSANNDLEKVKASLLYRHSNRIDYNFAHTFFHDNLDNQKEATTYNYKPEIGVSFKRIFNRRYARTNLKYNFNLEKSDAKRVEDNIIALNYRDRLQAVNLNFNVNYGEEEAEIGSDINKENNINYNLSLGTRKRMQGYILRPTLKFGYFNSEDENENTNDSNFEKSLGLRLDIPQKRFYSNLEFGERDSQRDSGEDNNKLFANLSFYYTPQLFDKYNQGRIYLRYRYNDLSYSDSEENDLRENSITAGVNLSF